jgi:hypothetical protein
MHCLARKRYLYLAAAVGAVACGSGGAQSQEGPSPDGSVASDATLTDGPGLSSDATNPPSDSPNAPSDAPSDAGGPVPEASSPAPCPAPSSVAAHQVVWTSPSTDETGSMPLGNGDVAINAWVLKTGDLVFYIAKADAWGGGGVAPYPMKLGRVRLSFAPNPFGSTPFTQTLAIDKGEMLVQAGAAGNQTTVTLWVDANSPTVRMQSHSDSPVSVTATLETWRSDDVVLPAANDAVTWYHRDTTSPWTTNLGVQLLQNWPSTPGVVDPILNRTFGGTIRGDGLVSASGNAGLVSSAAQTDWSIDVHVLTATTASAAAWQQALEQQVTTTTATPVAAALAAHETWWSDFWGRSWIALDESTPNLGPVNQMYLLQRFMMAAEGRKGLPIKFNGGQFTVTGTSTAAPKFGIDEALGTPDYRKWGGGYWIQNTRIMYWPMLAAGDFDLMQPLLTMYGGALPLRTAQTKALYNIDGAYWPETMNFWGSYIDNEYQLHEPHIWRHFNGSLEIVALMLDYFAYTQDQSFAQNVLIPAGEAVTTFFDLEFPARTAQGKIDMPNGQALETYWADSSPPVHNPTPDLAGLGWDLDGLLALPAGLVPAATMTQWQTLRAAVPDLATGVSADAGQKIFPAIPPLPTTHNTENVELYPVFPYRVYGVGKPNLDIAVATYNTRPFPFNSGWGQDVVHAAYLGLADQAATQLIQRTSFPTAGRFPGFFTSVHDWAPDQEHAAQAMTALQRMAIQPDAGKILLFPAWPAGWGADFRFAAPLNTMVECTIKGGVIQRISVTPASRYADIVVPSGMTLPPNGPSVCVDQ